MEMKRILEMAWFTALNNWEAEDKFYRENPNELTKARMENAWSEMKEIEQMVKDEEMK